MTIGTGRLDAPESRAWLEAMFSEDTQQMEDFIMNKLDGAIFEFAFDPKMEQTGSGVTVKDSAPPAPAADKLPD